VTFLAATVENKLQPAANAVICLSPNGSNWAVPATAVPAGYDWAMGYAALLIALTKHSKTRFMLTEAETESPAATGLSRLATASRATDKVATMVSSLVAVGLPTPVPALANQ
jgi:hypothetical protein